MQIHRMLTILNSRRKSIRKYAVLFVIALFVIIFYNLPSFFNRNNNQFNRNLFYTIVIDAGSTGSRIHVFKLDHDFIKTGL